MNSRCIGLFIFLVCSLSFAKTTTRFGIDLKLDSQYFSQKYGSDTNQDIERIQLIPSMETKFNENWRFTFKPDVELSPGNKSEEERVYFDLNETYLRWRNDLVTVQMGTHIFFWGVTDGYNPVDIVNPRQYFDPLRSHKRGAPSLFLKTGTESLEWEVLYIPNNAESILPGTQSRWLPRKVFVPRTVDNNVVLLLPDDVHYTYGSRTTLDRARTNNVGTRVQWHLPKTDLGLMYFDGLSPFPLVQPEVTGDIIEVSPKIVIDVDPDVVLNLRNYRQRMGGFTLVRDQWETLFKYSTAYSQSVGSTDPLLPGWTHENVLGVEKIWSFANDRQLISILQYSFIETQKENDSNMSIVEIFRRAWMIGLRYSWSEGWTASAMGLYDTLRGSHWQEYTLSKKFYDTWTLQLGADFIYGKDDTPLGIYNQNDNYSLSLSASF